MMELRTPNIDSPEARKVWESLINDRLREPIILKNEKVVKNVTRKMTGGEYYMVKAKLEAMRTVAKLETIIETIKKDNGL